MMRNYACLLLCVSVLVMAIAPREMAYAKAVSVASQLAMSQVVSLPTLEPVGGTGSFVEAVAISGTLAYLGEGSQLTILDVSVPAVPVLLTRLPVGGEIRDINVVGDRAFVANYRNMFQVVDVHDVLHPQLVATLNTPGSLTDMQVVGTRIYVSNYNHGLHIIDISDPDLPVLVGSPNPPLGSAEGIQVVGQYAYIASLGGLVILDITNAAAPTQVGFFNTASDGTGNGFGLDVEGQLAYLADGGGGLQIINISDPAHPQRVGSFDTPTFARDVQVEGTRAYVADRDSGVIVIDVGNPASPQLLGSFATESMTLRLEVVNNNAYVATYVNGLQILDIHDPKPSLIGSYGTSGNSWQVSTEDGFAYIASGKEGLQVVDVRTPSRPMRYAGLALPGAAYAVHVVDHTAYVGDGDQGRLHIVDVSDPAHPQLRSSVSTPQGAGGIAVVGSRVYVAAGGGGLQIVDASDLDHPTLLGGINFQIFVRDVVVVGTVAFVAAEFGGFHMVDVSNPAHPTALGSVQTDEIVEAVDVVGTVAYLATTSETPFPMPGPPPPTPKSGLRIFDISDPAHPLLRSSVDLPQGASDIQIVGTRAYVVAKNEGVRVYDVSGSTEPVLLDSAPISLASALKVADDLVYVVGYTVGLQIFTINPQFKTSQTTVTPSGGSANSTDGTIQLQFEAGTFAGPVTVLQLGRIGIPASSNGANDVVRSFSSEARTANGQSIRQVARPYTMQVSYTDEQLARLGISETSLNLATWDGIDWVDMLPCAGCYVDMANNRINVSLNRFATFALVRSAAQPVDPVVALSASAYRATEAAGTTAITVMLSTPAPAPIRVRYTTSDGSATAGSDYIATSGTLSFNTGETLATFDVALTNDLVQEADETVLLTLTDPANVALGAPSSAILTIADNDSTVVPRVPTVQFSATAYTMSARTATVVVTVTLDAPATQTVEVDYAIEGVPSIGSTGTLRIAAGAMEATFMVPIASITTNNRNEVITLLLRNPHGATLGATSRATLTILDDLPVVSLSTRIYLPLVKR